MILFAAALYFGCLWNNRGAREYRQLLAIKELDRQSKISSHLNPNHSVEQELETAH